MDCKFVDKCQGPHKDQCDNEGTGCSLKNLYEATASRAPSDHAEFALLDAGWLIEWDGCKRGNWYSTEELAVMAKEIEEFCGKKGVTITELFRQTSI